MTTDNPQGTDGGELSISEAAAAYATFMTPEEPGADAGQPEDDEEQGAAPTDADEPAEGEGEPDDEGQAEDDDPEPEPEAPAYVGDDAKVKLADGTEITVGDLKNGTLRLQDYRRKTEEVARERETLTAKSSQVQQLEQQLTEEREFLAQLVQSVMPQKPDISMISVDPVGYAQANAEYQTRKEQIEYLLGQNRQAAERQTAEKAEKDRAKVGREWAALLDHMPELRDGNRLRSFAAEIQDVGGRYGYTAQELGQIGMDHRQVRVMADAIQWQKLQASKSKVTAKVEGRPPVQRGGTRQSPDQQKARDVRVAMDRLTKSGTLKDGVAALLALEKG